jgi:Fe2+ or Zn2+ uptake regulation protein
MADPPGKDRYEAEWASAVMEYLARHPQAMDTVEGVAEWWLPQMHLPADLAGMRRVLDELAEQGLLERVAAEEHVHYRLRKG